METIETDDIFKGASLMCLGADLQALRRKGSNVSFTLTGDHLCHHDLHYRTGRALVNPLQLKETLNLLRDLIFEKARLTTLESGRQHDGALRRR